MLRPVLRGMCLYESVTDGRLSLLDVAIMNDALDVMDENAARQQKAVQNGR